MRSASAADLRGDAQIGSAGAVDVQDKLRLDFWLALLTSAAPGTALITAVAWSTRRLSVAGSGPWTGDLDRLAAEHRRSRSVGKADAESRPRDVRGRASCGTSSAICDELRCALVDRHQQHRELRRDRHSATPKPLDRHCRCSSTPAHFGTVLSCCSIFWTTRVGRLDVVAGGMINVMSTSLWSPLGKMSTPIAPARSTSAIRRQKPARRPGR